MAGNRNAGKNSCFFLQEYRFVFRYHYESRKDVDIMRGRMRIFTFLIAAVLCFSCTGALAEFSPRYERLSAGENAALEISGKLQSLRPLGSQSLEIVNEWLDGLTFRASVGKNASVEIAKNGESLISAFVEREAGYTLTAFQPSGSFYLTDPAGPDALRLITGQDVSLPDLSVLPALYTGAAPGLYEALEKYVTPKKVKEPTSAKNASTSTAYVNYLFPDGKLNEAWPDVLEAILPCFREALKEQPGWYAEAEKVLSALEFSGECRFKRLLDKEGNDMGLQFTGKAAKEEDKRKVTLFYGWTPEKGGYVSMNLTGIGSKNSLKASFGVKMTAKKSTSTLAVDGSLNRVLNGKTTAYTLSASLKNALSEESEHWTGKITYTATENKEKTTWTLTPDLTFDENGLEGDAGVERKTESKVTLKAKVHVSLATVPEEKRPAARSAKDLRGLTEEKARVAVLSELAPLTGAVASLTAGLPEKVKTQLLHELRTDEWMNGASVPVPDKAD